MKIKKPVAKYSSVMLVDDDEIDNFINQKMLEGFNFSERIYIHTSGKSALEFLQNLERGANPPKELIPRILFLDINMPLMDGFQFLQQFSLLSPLIKDTCKIVMLTSSINPSDVERSKENPYIIKYVNKPLTNAVLETL